MKIFSRSNIFILVHFFCWLILTLGVLYSHPADWGDNVPREFYIRQNVLLIILIIVFYLNYNLLIPYLLIKKTVVWYILVVLAIVAGCAYLTNIINEVFDLNRMPFPHPHGGPNRHHINTFVPGMIVLIIGLGITVSFIQKWQQEVILRQQLEQEKITTELTLLKAQINPHFFFNTLNTIYSYTLSDGDVARTAITNLSKMMRYVLYDAAGKQTPLSKEIAFIKEYVELMKLRISKKTSLLLQVQEQPKEMLVAPMIFLPFIENAFKHGVSGVNEGHITIQIIQDDNSVELLVNNTVYETRSAGEDKSNGIGITNTTRRLELLYPGKYKLQTGLNSKNEYEAKLKLLI
ncbi:MAG: histidine kinase [Sphingobacteriaceae bacterium]|nr:MAG: histidine kinase [Sphingobacteriaceae bacterium]